MLPSASATWSKALPDVVIELLSDRTRHIDRGEKMEIYSRNWRTSEYFLYDPWSHELEGYRLDPERNDYVRIPSDAAGDLYCRRLGLGLGLRRGSYEGVETTWLRWLGPGGCPLETTEEAGRATTAALSAERLRKQAAEQRADHAERRLRELEARLKRE